MIIKLYNFNTKKLNKFPSGVNTKVINLIVLIKKEPNFIKQFRLQSYYIWITLNQPNWSYLNINPINFNHIKCYSKLLQIQKQKIKNANIIKNLDINNNSNSIDIIINSNSVLTTYKKKLAKLGIIFSSISDAIKLFPNLIKKYLGTVVSKNDNFFAALNSAVFSDGSFCYIPQNQHCPIELSTYFTINDKSIAQFERTLIIVAKNGSVKYVEGCTANKANQNQLHAAIVELIAYENANIQYSTIQNWYSGNKANKGGIYNFVTKRGLCLGNNSQINWIQVELGSAITWKYPSCILMGFKSKGSFNSLTYTTNFQQTDTGTKMIHLGKYTISYIKSKAITCKNSKNYYRSLIKIGSNALYSNVYSQCDSFIFNNTSFIAAYPYIDINNSTSKLEHEAKLSKISFDQLFYLKQRGISLNSSIQFLINVFCNDIITQLSNIFKIEITKLLGKKINKILIDLNKYDIKN